MSIEHLTARARARECKEEKMSLHEALRSQHLVLIKVSK
jgi:hypothetical protein